MPILTEYNRSTHADVLLKLARGLQLYEPTRVVQAIHLGAGTFGTVWRFAWEEGIMPSSRFLTVKVVFIQLYAEGGLSVDFTMNDVFREEGAFWREGGIANTFTRCTRDIHNLGLINTSTGRNVTKPRGLYHTPPISGRDQVYMIGNPTDEARELVMGNRKRQNDDLRRITHFGVICMKFTGLHNVRHLMDGLPPDSVARELPEVKLDPFDRISVVPVYNELLKNPMMDLQIMADLCYITWRFHGCGFAHRDLSTNNIFLKPLENTSAYTDQATREQFQLGDGQFEYTHQHYVPPNVIRFRLLLGDLASGAMRAVRGVNARTMRAFATLPIRSMDRLLAVPFLPRNHVGFFDVDMWALGMIHLNALWKRWDAGNNRPGEPSKLFQWGNQGYFDNANDPMNTLIKETAAIVLTAFNRGGGIRDGGDVYMSTSRSETLREQFRFLWVICRLHYYLRVLLITKVVPASPERIFEQDPKASNDVEALGLPLHGDTLTMIWQNRPAHLMVQRIFQFMASGEAGSRYPEAYQQLMRIEQKIAAFVLRGGLQSEAQADWLMRMLAWYPEERAYFAPVYAELGKQVYLYGALRHTYMKTKNGEAALRRKPNTPTDIPSMESRAVGALYQIPAWWKGEQTNPKEEKRVKTSPPGDLVPTKPPPRPPKKRQHQITLQWVMTPLKGDDAAYVSIRHMDNGTHRCNHVHLREQLEAHWAKPGMYGTCLACSGAQNE